MTPTRPPTHAAPDLGSSPAPATRVVRTTYRGLARREQILAAATSMFLDHGYTGVSIDEIVKAVGGSKTNVYSQFGNKEGLFAAVVQTLCADFLHDFIRLDISGLDAGNGLRRLGRELLGILLKDAHIAFQRLIIAESGRFPALSQVWYAAGPQQSRQFMASFIESKQRDGSLRPCDPMTAATLFHDMVVSDPLYRALQRQVPDLRATRRHVDSAVEAFLHGHLIASDADSHPDS